MRHESQFKTEAALCAAFMNWAKTQGWTPYPETSGWDVLLVGGDGTQIGVQAKLRFNMGVLRQVVPDQFEAWQKEGPDFRAVLVPSGQGEEKICGALGITVITAYSDGSAFFPRLDERSGLTWHYWNPEKRHALPRYVPDVPAGASAPVQLTRWKVAALQVTAVLELRGHVTRADFRRYGIDPRRWINDNAWLVAGSAPGQFVRGPNLAFDKQHPDVYPQVLADVRADLAAQPGALL